MEHLHEGKTLIYLDTRVICWQILLTVRLLCLSLVPCGSIALKYSYIFGEIADGVQEGC